VPDVSFSVDSTQKLGGSWSLYPLWTFCQCFCLALSCSDNLSYKILLTIIIRETRSKNSNSFLQHKLNMASSTIGMRSTKQEESSTDRTSRLSHHTTRPRSRQEGRRSRDDFRRPTKLAADEEEQQEECFEILYFREVQGCSTRSFEDFSCSNDHDSSDCTLNDSLGDFGFDHHEDDDTNNDNKEEDEALKELKRKIKKTRKALEKEKLVADGGMKAKNKSSKKSKQGGASSPPSSTIVAEEEPRRRRRNIVRKNKLSRPRDDDDCHGDDDSRPPRPDNMNKKNTILIVNRSATNRSEMSQLIKDLRKDRERAERDREIALRLKHEMQTFDVILAEKAGGAKETFAACSETMAEVQYLLSKLAAARLVLQSASVTPPNKPKFSSAA
jgi:hypothetical protein